MDNNKKDLENLDNGDTIPNQVFEDIEDMKDIENIDIDLNL